MYEIHVRHTRERGWHWFDWGETRDEAKAKAEVWHARYPRLDILVVGDGVNPNHGHDIVASYTGEKGTEHEQSN